MTNSKSDQTARPKSRPVVCDCCRIRRIKCDGLEPCWRCITSGLKCTFSAAKKRGPRGNGSAVLTLLRQRQGVNATAGNEPIDSLYMAGLRWDKFNLEDLKKLIGAYFEYINPIVPILVERDVMKMLEEPPTEETYTLVTALAAVPLQRVQLNSENQEGMRDMLLNEAMRVKSSLAFITLDSVTRSKVAFLIYLSFCASEEYETAWYFLHEAIMIAQLMRLDDEATYEGLSAEEDLDRRILYWGLFISDRGFAIHERKTVILHKSIRMPSADKDSVYNEFVSLLRVMASVEDAFVDAWNKSPLDVSPNSLPMEIEVSRRIQDRLTQAIQNIPNFQSGIQKSNVLVTQPWLLLLLWQICDQNGHQTGSSNALFPAYIANVAVQASASVSTQDLLAHGPGMRKKFFDIGHSLAEAAIANPQSLLDAELDVQNVMVQIIDRAKSLSISKPNMATFKVLEGKMNEALQVIEVTVRTRWLYSENVINELNEFYAATMFDEASSSNSYPAPHGAASHSATYQSLISGSDASSSRYISEVSDEDSPANTLTHASATSWHQPESQLILSSTPTASTPCIQSMLGSFQVQNYSTPTLELNKELGTVDGTIWPM